MAISFFLAIAFLAVSAQGALYGVTKQNQLGFLDVNGSVAGLWTLVGDAFADRHMITLIQIADIDADSNIFYVIAANHSGDYVGLELIGLSMSTGQITSDTPLPFDFSFNYVNTPGVDWIPGGEDVLVYGLNGHKHQFEIYRVTPSNGSLVQIANWPQGSALIQSVDSFDTTNNVLWVQLEDNNSLFNFGFDITSGKLVYNLSDSYGLQSLGYDSIKDRVVGLGAPSGSSTPLVALADGAYTVLGQVQGTLTLAGPDDVGIDTENRIMYAYADNGTTVELVLINIDTAEMSSLPYTDGVSLKPVTVAFANAA